PVDLPQPQVGNQHSANQQIKSVESVRNGHSPQSTKNRIDGPNYPCQPDRPGQEDLAARDVAEQHEMVCFPGINPKNLLEIQNLDEAGGASKQNNGQQDRHIGNDENKGRDRLRAGSKSFLQ